MVSEQIILQVPIEWLFGTIAGALIWKILDRLVTLRYGERERSKADIVEAITNAIGDAGAKVINQLGKFFQIKNLPLEIENLPDPEVRTEYNEKIETKYNEILEVVQASHKGMADLTSEFSQFRSDVNQRLNAVEALQKVEAPEHDNLKQYTEALEKSNPPKFDPSPDE